MSLRSISLDFETITSLPNRILSAVMTRGFSSIVLYCFFLFSDAKVLSLSCRTGYQKFLYFVIRHSSMKAFMCFHPSSPTSTRSFIISHGTTTPVSIYTKTSYPSVSRCLPTTKKEKEKSPTTMCSYKKITIRVKYK